MSRPRVMCFIDSSNLYSYLRDAFGSGKYRQDALCEALTGPDRDLVEWRFYAARLPPGESDKQKANAEAQQRFFDVIASRPKCVLRLGRFLVEGEPPHLSLKEKGVDGFIILDLIRLAGADRFDVAIVMSGDEDLVSVIQAVREDHGKRVEIALPGAAQAYHVRKAADGFVEITQEMFERVKL